LFDSILIIFGRLFGFFLSSKAKTSKTEASQSFQGRTSESLDIAIEPGDVGGSLFVCNGLDNNARNQTSSTPWASNFPIVDAPASHCLCSASMTLLGLCGHELLLSSRQVTALLLQ
jgi:hypothetical protein